MFSFDKGSRMPCKSSTTFRRNADRIVNNKNKPDERNKNNSRSSAHEIEFCKYEVQRVIRKLEESPYSRDTVQTVINWLINGECNRDTVGDFVNILNSLQYQVVNIMSERARVKRSINKRKAQRSNELLDIKYSLAELSKVIECTKKQKVWDNFQKNQRKELESCFEEFEALAKEVSDSKDDIEAEYACYENYEHFQEINKSQLKIGGIKKEPEQDAIAQNEGNNLIEKLSCKEAFTSQASSNKQYMTSDEVKLVALIGVYLNHQKKETIENLYSYVAKFNANYDDLNKLKAFLKRNSSVFKLFVSGAGSNLQTWVSYSNPFPSN